MQTFNRADRVGAELQRALASLLSHTVRDERLQQVTLQEVRVVRDLSHARVFYTLADPAEAKTLTPILNKAAGYLRHQLSSQLKLRTVPVLHFEYDPSIETGLHLSALIEQAVAGDNPQTPQTDHEQNGRNRQNG